MPWENANPQWEPRYEHRVFLRQGGPAAFDSREVYALPAERSRFSVKLRDGALEIKELMSTVEGYQLWRPVARFVEPACDEALGHAAVQELASPGKGRRLIDRLCALEGGDAAEVGDTLLCPVSKRRRSFEVEGARAEEVALEIGGRRYVTHAVEHETLATAKQAARALGIASQHGESYPQFLARVLRGRNSVRTAHRASRA